MINQVAIQPLDTFATREEWNVFTVIRIDGQLVFLESPDLPNLLPRLYADPLLNRFVHRYYLLDKTLYLNRGEHKAPPEPIYCRFFMSAVGCKKSHCEHLHLKGAEKVAALAQDKVNKAKREEEDFQNWVSENKEFLFNACASEKDAVFRIQSFPRSFEHFYGQLLPESIQLNPKAFTHILSITYASDKLTIGISSKDLYYVADESLTTNEDAISRAYYKMIEALTRFPFKVSADWIAIDVGSSPGGWTQALSQRVKHVYSLDPAPLRIEIPPNVTFWLKKVENCIDDLQKVGPINMLVCDMVGTMNETLKILTPLYSLLTSGGVLILTLKLFRRKEERLDLASEEAIQQFQQIAPLFEDVQVKWLLTNRYERTLFARKK